MAVFAGIELPDRQNIDLPDLGTARAVQAAVDATLGYPEWGNRVGMGHRQLERIGRTVTNAVPEPLPEGRYRYQAYSEGANIAYIRQLWADYRSFDAGPLRGTTQSYRPGDVDQHWIRASGALREFMHDVSPVLARDAVDTICLEHLDKHAARVRMRAAGSLDERWLPFGSVREALDDIASKGSRVLPTPLWWRTADAEAVVLFSAGPEAQRLGALPDRPEFVGLPRSLPEALLFILAFELSRRDALDYRSEAARSFLRRAGALLLAIATRCPGQDAPEFPLFEALDQLASSQYEKRPTRAIIGFVARFDEIDWKARLVLPVQIIEQRTKQRTKQWTEQWTEQRMARKLLEVGRDEDDAVISDGVRLFGIAKIKAGQPAVRCTVRFRLDASWDFYTGVPRKTQGPIFRVVRGIPSLAGAARIERAPLNDAWIHFPRVDGPLRRAIWQFCAAAAELGHGALIVVAENAAGEAKRLRPQSVEIEPVTLTRALARLTQVDGAVLVDLDGICHAFGVILDGVAPTQPEGDPGRGSRYNSALRYCRIRNAHSTTAIAIVLSEDGMVNVLS